MNISNINVYLNRDPGHKVKAYISLVLDEHFAVHDIMVVEGDRGLYITMPRRHCSDGTYRDIFHPISRGARSKLSDLCIFAYEQEKRKVSL